MKKRISIAILASSLTLGVLGAGAGITYAAFVAKTPFTVPNGVMTPLGTTVFLDPGVWDNGDGGAAFCVYIWTQSKTSTKFIPSVYTTSAGHAVFDLDLDNYKNGGFIFVRYNPNYAVSSLGWTSAKEVIYNKTYDFEISASGQIQIESVTTFNTFSISGWGTEKFKDGNEQVLGTISTGLWSTTTDN